MTALLVLFCVSCVIAIAGLFVLFRSHARELPGWQESDIQLTDFVDLRAMRFRNFPLLFSDSDCRELAADPRLIRVARRLRKDRKRQAMDWLASLRSDVLCLARLRRLLTAYGVSENIPAEFRSTARLVSILALILALRLGTFLFGPFVFQRAARMGRRYMETYSHLCHAALHRLPRNKWDIFRAEWQNQQISAAWVE